MLELEVFVRKYLTSIYRFTATTIKLRKITTLRHETRYNPMEVAARIAQGLTGIWTYPIHPGAQLNEVFYGFGHRTAK